MKNRLKLLIASLGLMALAGSALGSDKEPWKAKDNAIIIDAYEMNIIDWPALLSNKRIAAFIHKASDGLPEAFDCSGDHNGDTVAHCKTMWRKYAVSRELFQTRKLVAKSAGLLWGAYHLARPGNPIDQANHFLDYAQPDKDDLMVLDLEGMDDKTYMSLDDALIFVRHIKVRTGRYPILYTNHITASYISHHRDTYGLLARLPLWYARYKPDIGGVFPLGNWENYAIWQFSSGINCNRRSCPYRAPGTLNDIDVNVVAMTKTELKAAWPFGSLLPSIPPVPLMASTGRAHLATMLDMTATASITPNRSLQASGVAPLVAENISR